MYGRITAGNGPSSDGPCHVLMVGALSLAVQALDVDDSGQVADLIQRKRRKRYPRQQDFAKALGVSQSTVSRWESGSSLPNYPQAQKLQRHFGGRISDYLG